MAPAAVVVPVDLAVAAVPRLAVALPAAAASAAAAVHPAWVDPVVPPAGDPVDPDEAVPASAAAPRVPSGGPVVPRAVDASPSGHVVKSSSRWKRRPLAACVSARATARPFAWRAAPRLTDFAEKIGVDPASLVQMLFHLGEMVTATESVNDATLQLLGEELNYTVEVVSPEDEDRELLDSFDLQFGSDEGDEAMLEARPPVVTVMGHVDHGKTKLLDALRTANVVDKEAGGITQHIGAYQVHTEVDGTDRRITLIDTPGHEAFTAMRARGAQATDIAVLVVAADDGVMPQTVEALNHAKAAEVPIVVAVNKIDKPDSDPTKVRGQLAEYGVVPEEYGGDVMFVDVSAKSQLNLDKLLEAVVLTADASLDLRANPDQDAQGLVIEAHLDRGRGPVATILVQRGTLRVGDSIVAGPAYGRVRAMLDEHGETIEQADPSRPAMVLGLSGVPGAGQNFIVVEDDRDRAPDRRTA